jgi:Na+/H+-dicarboxylate symporter
MNSFIRVYFFPLLLLTALFLGGLFGVFFPIEALKLQSIGDVFLRLLLTFVVPLIFFTVTSAIAKTRSLQTLKQLLLMMVMVFLVMGVVVAALCLFFVKFFAISANIEFSKVQEITLQKTISWADFFTVSDFSKLFSHEHMLALIIFAIIVGLATNLQKEKSQLFIQFLHAGEQVFMQAFKLIMYFAPIGFFAYFSHLVATIGPSFLWQYAKVIGFYYGFAITFFVLVYSVYAYIYDTKQGLRVFWREVYLPAITALGTCSSVASIPSNFIALKKIGVHEVVYDTVLPLGSLIHKEGSVMGGIVKIAFLFAVYHMNFSGIDVFLKAIIVALFIGSVMGGIPGGGMLGDLFVVAAYGFPSSALILIATISLVIDPLATMLNVTGNTIATMLIDKFVKKKIF